MNKWLRSITGLSLALAGSLAAQAQTPAAMPPNILSIQTDNIKPYADGPYDRVASEYPALSRQLEDPTHVLGMEGLTGSPRAIYITGFDSYEALQKNEEWLAGDSAADAKFDSLDARVAPYLSEVSYAVWHYRPELSNNVAAADLPHSRYWEVIVYHMRAGHVEEFAKMTKMYRDANLKIGQNVPWTTYESQMGVTDSFLIMVPMTSLKNEDAFLAHDKDFSAALGDDGKTQMNKLSEESVASVEDNIWMVIPEWSYVDKSWIDADPQFWGPAKSSAARSGSKPTARAMTAPKAPPAD